MHKVYQAKQTIRIIVRWWAGITRIEMVRTYKMADKMTYTQNHTFWRERVGFKAISLPLLSTCPRQSWSRQNPPHSSPTWRSLSKTTTTNWLKKRNRVAVKISYSQPQMWILSRRLSSWTGGRTRIQRYKMADRRAGVKRSRNQAAAIRDLWARLTEIFRGWSDLTLYWRSTRPSKTTKTTMRYKRWQMHLFSI